MQDAVNALADRLDLRQIRQLGRLESFVSAEIGGRLEIAQHQIGINRRQEFSQTCADGSRCAGD
jgi:hypothetical protein